VGVGDERLLLKVPGIHAAQVSAFRARSFKVALRPPRLALVDGPDEEQATDLTPETGGMLISREEMRFDFGAAKFRLPADALILKWIFDQFLYGEITGIQCGHWLYRAPSLEAAAFFARQAVEELSHVRQFLRIYDLIDLKPGPAHPLIRFMATGSMGTDYVEHVATEMAVGEGLVLTIFYALIDTIEDKRVVKILESAARQEERHVAFGERQTRRLVEQNPRLASCLLGLNLGSILAMDRLAGYVSRRLGREHEVLRQAPAFLQHLVAILELRLQRMGILSGRIAQIKPLARLWLIASAYLRHWLGRLRPRRKLLTRTYLDDPSIKSLD